MPDRVPVVGTVVDAAPPDDVVDPAPVEADRPVVVDVVGAGVVAGEDDVAVCTEAADGCCCCPDAAPGPKPSEPASARPVMAAAPPTASTRWGAGEARCRGGSVENTFDILGVRERLSDHLNAVRRCVGPLVYAAPPDHSCRVPRCLVTGPTSGIGHAFATALAAAGNDLVLVSRDTHRLGRVADELGAAHGVSTEVLTADLSDLEQTRRVEARLRSEPFAVVVNNAGYGMTGTFEVNDVEAEQESLDVLVRAVMRLSHAALQPMLAAGSGAIVNVSSVAGYLPRGTYGAHKAWVTSFSGWANVHYRSSGVRVMALCPGFVHTEFHSRMQANLGGIPGWMWLDADTVVRTALRDLYRGKAVSIPTRRYQALTTLARATPRRAMEKIARRGR